VRIWLSEQAATYDGVGDRIRSYLDETLSLEYWTLEASIGGTVSVSTEDAARLTRRGSGPWQSRRGRSAGATSSPRRTSTCW